MKNLPVLAQNSGQNLFMAVCMVALMAVATPAYAAVGNEKSASYVRDAEKYLKKGDVKAAIIQLKNAVVADPKNPENRATLAALYLQVQNPESAEKEYMRALELGIERSKVIINLSKTRLLLRKYQLVLDSLDENDVSDAERGDAYLIIGNAHQGLKDTEKALEYFEKGEEAGGQTDGLSVAIAQIYYFQKDMKRAEEKADEALVINPKNVKGLILKGELVNQQSGPEKSLTYFEQALEYEPKNISALFKVAAILFDLNRSDEALEKLDIIYSVAPKLPLANYLSAVIYARKNDLDKAEEFLNASGQALDDFPGALILRGVINYSRQNYAQAIYNLNKMVKLVPDNVVARRLLGASLLRQNDAEQAIKVLMPVVESGKAGSVIYALLGSANMKLGKFEEGTTYFERAVEDKPGESKLKTQLALSKLASGDSKAALTNLEEILAEDPNSKQAAVFMSLISLREKNFDKAIESADKLIAQDTENPVGYNLKGSAYVGQKNTQQARVQFEKAIAVEPSYYSASMNLAQLELKEGNEEKALKIYRDILKEDKDYSAALLAMARHMKGKKNFADAEKYYQRTIDSAPKNIRAVIEFTEFFVMQKKIDRAKAIAQQIIVDFPDQAAGYEANGNIDLIRRDAASAVNNFGRMAAILGNNAGAYQLLGRAQMRNNDASNARKTFLKALPMAKNKMLLLIDLAMLEINQKNYGKAQEYIDQLKNNNEKNFTPYVLEGNLLAVQGKKAASLASYQKASEMGASGSRFTVEIARSYISNNQAGKAQEVMHNWLATNNNDLAVRHILASYYLQEKSYQKSIGQYETILGLDEKNAVALNNVAWLYSQVGQDKRALSTAEKAYNLFPDEAPFIDTYAWILVQRGENAKGLELLQKAISKAPDMVEIRYHFAVALKNAGRRAVAKKELETVIASGKEFPGIENARKLLNELSR
ncbi:hypothetical protein MNBD_ALPHA01-1048 [hydrothermal vent metagenome]|uniref:Uncharacterized protein n=1 Tax=hydrothermal vent metagenome TaxID=652676 RepID=A0A3B0T4R5_9ZZZZ